MTTTIGTHNGVFHADDAFACAVLRLVYGGDVQIIRTRDHGQLQTCSYMVDVGGRHDPMAGAFDHHQRGGAGARENGVPFSSFGLVWKEFGVRVCGDQKVADKVDEVLVTSIDAADCGFALQGAPKIAGARSMSLSAAISLLNPTWEERSAFDDAFAEAVSWATTLLRRAIASAKGTVNAESAVRKAQETAAGGPIVALEKFVPWGEYSFPEEHLFLVFPSEVGTWMVQAIPPVPGSFDKRKPLPETWAGLRDEELDRVTGVTGCVFCHTGRFIAGHKTLFGALALARLAVEA